MGRHRSRASSFLLVGVRSLALSGTSVCFQVLNTQKLRGRFLLGEAKRIPLFKNFLRLEALNNEVFVDSPGGLSIIL